MAQISARNQESGKTNVSMNLFVLVFPEDGLFFAYSPELDLTAYGDSEEEAMRELDVVIANYLEYAFRNQTLQHDLFAHGWTLGEDSNSVIKPPSFNDMLNRNEDLREKFHSVQKTTSRPFKMPAFA